VALVKKWDTLSSKEICNLKIFKAVSKDRQHPDSDVRGEFTVLESKDWVNIIPITEKGEIVLIEQYRHGVDEVSLEIPGGLVEFRENPASAAVRELQEETGYASDSEPVFLGEQQPNPAFLNNKCSTFLLENCSFSGETNFDEHEDIKVRLVKKENIESMIKSGEINHGVIITAFYFYSLFCGN
jgi:ADP-ribose pyrophosphatase